MSSLSLKRIDDYSTHAVCEDVGVDETISNLELGNRIPAILEMMHEKIMRASMRGVDEQDCIDYFHRTMQKMAIKYGDRDDFTSQARFKSAQLILRRSIGEWTADDIIDEFLDNHFPDVSRIRQTILPPPSTDIPEPPPTLRSMPEMAVYYDDND